MFLSIHGGLNMNSNVGTILAFVGLVGFSLIWAVNIYRDRHYLKSLYVDWLNKHARAWLLKHDSLYQMRYIGNEIVLQRETARDRNATEDEIDNIDNYFVAKSLGLESKL